MKKAAIIFMTTVLLAAEVMPVNADFEQDTAVTYESTVQGLVYLCDSYPLRSRLDGDAEILVELPSGHTVEILDTLYGETEVWCHVSTMVDEIEYTGYIERGNLAIANEEYLRKESEVSAGSAYNVKAYGSDIEHFPESYQNALRQLKASHPNWVFVPFHTGLDWEYVIDNEMLGERSLIGSYKGDAWKEDTHSPGWCYASRSAVKYYMDPRNFLDEVEIFQFEQLTYNESYHSVEATQNILSNTFMYGNMPGSEGTYAENFVNIGRSLG